MRNWDRQNWILNQTKGGAILDVGFLDYSSKKNSIHVEIIQKNPQSLVVGLDNDKNIFHQSNNLICTAGSITAIPFKKKTFDCVVVGEILEHILDINLAISELSRVTKKGGRVIVTTPNPYAIFRMFRNWLLSKNIAGKANISSFLGSKYHVIYWEPLSLINIFQKYGLNCEVLTTKNLTIPYLPEFLKNPNIWIWPFNRLGTNFCAVFVKK